MVEEYNQPRFTIKYKDGDFVCDVEGSDLGSPEKQEVDKRTEFASKVLRTIRGYYPSATDIRIGITSDDSNNAVGFVNDAIPVDIVWRKWGDEHYLVYLSEIDEITRRFIERYPAIDAPVISGYPYVTAIPTMILEILDDIFKTTDIVWHRLTDAA
nr:MAG TPA: hypothetical protein [Caudoviricetes sp.]